MMLTYDRAAASADAWTDGQPRLHQVLALAHQNERDRTSYADGKYHASLTNYSATPGGHHTPFPQPHQPVPATANAQMRPTGNS